MAGIAVSHSACLPLPSWPSSVRGPTPRPKKRDRGLNRSIVLDPLVNPGNQAHRHEACAAAHLARTLTRLVVMAQGSSSQRAQGPSQEEIATVVLGWQHTRQSRVKRSALSSLLRIFGQVGLDCCL